MSSNCRRSTRDGANGLDRAGAQSSILALNNHQLLILSRDGNGRGATGAPVFKSILLADLMGATNFDGQFDGEGVNGDLTSTGDTLKAGITPLSWTEALNMLGRLDPSMLELEKFYLNINAAPGDTNSLCEKWEALALVSAGDPLAPNDYFLFLGNDNDFLTASGKYLDAAGALQNYDAGLENDTMVLAYRVRVLDAPTPPAPLIAAKQTTISDGQGARHWSHHRAGHAATRGEGASAPLCCPAVGCRRTLWASQG